MFIQNGGDRGKRAGLKTVIRVQPFHDQLAVIIFGQSESAVQGVIHAGIGFALEGEAKIFAAYGKTIFLNTIPPILDFLQGAVAGPAVLDVVMQAETTVLRGYTQDGFVDRGDAVKARGYY
jgi:hypothetical protein